MGKKHLLITCLITLLCTLCFFCILCSNNIFSLYTDYNSDNKEREKLLREIISSIKSEIKYSKNDAIALVGDSPDDLTNTVFYADICTRESAQMLFQCIENCESISDISNTPQHHGYLPIKINGIGLCDFNCLDIELQHTHQIFCIKFAKNDSEALYEYFHKMGNTLKEDANTRADLLEEAIKVYDSMIDYYDSDYISVVENNNRIFVDNIVIRTPETAKMLFNCIRNATIINDYTGVPLKPEKPEIFINEEPIGTFNHVYLRFPPTGRYLFFSFSEEDSKSLYEYVVNTKYIDQNG